jgi:hypothetical protein
VYQEEFQAIPSRLLLSITTELAETERVSPPAMIYAGEALLSARRLSISPAGTSTTASCATGAVTYRPSLKVCFCSWFRDEHDIKVSATNARAANLFFIVSSSIFYIFSVSLCNYYTFKRKFRKNSIQDGKRSDEKGRKLLPVVQ